MMCWIGGTAAVAPPADDDDVDVAPAVDDGEVLLPELMLGGAGARVRAADAAIVTLNSS